MDGSYGQATAAPTYFAPQMIEVMKDQQAAFIDGGLSMANNPSLTLLMIAHFKRISRFVGQWVKIISCLFPLEQVHGISKNMHKEIDDATMLSWAGEYS